ncbi:acetyltransferase [Psychroflexus maritimus]|uniref:acetyltransferase n=1 Tax=Psychroflexus maritimus TaxID=2714865 RepID=UPI00293BE725|nr:acetyltransferase [Psychroflexus maritimus]
MKKLNLFGASGHAKVVIDIITSNGFGLAYVFDDDKSIHKLLDYKVTTSYDSSLLKSYPLLVSIGDNVIRKEIALRTNINLSEALIHPSAIISSEAVLGKGTVVMPNVVINSGTRIGENCIINTSAVIEHDCIIKDYVHISPNAALAGGVKVREGSHVGIGANIIQFIEIGEWSNIGAGAVVVRNIPSHCTAVGIPAKPIKFHS